MKADAGQCRGRCIEFRVRSRSSLSSYFQSYNHRQVEENKDNNTVERTEPFSQLKRKIIEKTEMYALNALWT